MKVAVLGASTSAQTVKRDNGEVSGYCEVLRRRHLARICASSLRQFCYPSNRTSDGGLYRVGEVAQYRPDICIFEPLVEDLSRGSPPSRAELLFIYGRLVAAKVLPVTLLLPQPSLRTAKKWATYALFNQICAEFDLPIAEVDLTGVADIQSMFDGVHTREPGAELYASVIADRLVAIGDPRRCVERLSARHPDLGSSLQEVSLAVPPTKRINSMKLRLRTTGEQPCTLRVVQPQLIGPFSPVLNVSLSCLSSPKQDDRTEERSVWDPYCHYQRPSYVVLEEASIAAGSDCLISVSVSVRDPSYGECRRSVAQWPGVGARELRPSGPLKIFSTGPFEAELLSYG